MSELKFGCVEHLRWIRKHMAPQDDEHKVKPCPFCGDMPASMKAELDGKKRYGCKNCTPNLWYTPERWNTRRIEDALNARIAELERRAARAKELLQDEMGDWLTVEAIYMPDHYLQLKQTIDVLDGGGE